MYAAVHRYEFAYASGVHALPQTQCDIHRTHTVAYHDECACSAHLAATVAAISLF